MDADKKNKITWTEERIERLKELWAEGLSASEIAAVLGGVSRNAVIGKIYRLRLSGSAPARRAGPRKSAPPAARKSAPKHNGPAAGPATRGATALKTDASPAPMPRARTAPVALVETPCKGKISNIMELNHHTCRWPIGDPGDEDFAYCGDSSRPGSPYCEHHARIAYQPSGDRRRRAGG